MSPRLLGYLGGKPLNMRESSLSRYLVFLFAFVDRSSVAKPLQSRFLELPSNMSTTRLATDWLVVVVVASPNPPGFPHPAPPPPTPAPPAPPSATKPVIYRLGFLLVMEILAGEDGGRRARRHQLPSL